MPDGEASGAEGIRGDLGDLFAGPTAIVSTRVGSMRIGLDASFGAQLFKLNGESAVRPQATLGLVALFGVGQ